MKTIGKHEPENLYGGLEFPEIRDTRVIPDGVAVKRGDILCRDFTPIKNGGTADSIALDNIAADEPVRICAVAETGVFNPNALSTGDDTAPLDWKSDLRKLSIFLRHPAP